jgi:predicted O-methyltransferase YrrM
MPFNIKRADVPESIRPAVSAVYDFLMRRTKRRFAFAMSYLKPQIDHARVWSRSRSEESNFLYDITPASRLNLAHMVAVVFRTSVSRVEGLFAEIENDGVFRKHVEDGMRRHLPGIGEVAIGRRLGWYAAARILRPKIVVETGVDYGLGACVLCAALLRNTAEGFPGRYIGLEIRKEAGQLLTGPFAQVGRIDYGDSMTTLAAMDEVIDLFISDSDHSLDFEAREYETLTPKLSQHAVVLSDNSHFSPVLAKYSEREQRKFLFFREEPLRHWYPGAGIGFSYRD